jgi:hypothetical protein
MIFETIPLRGARIDFRLMGEHLGSFLAGTRRLERERIILLERTLRM